MTVPEIPLSPNPEHLRVFIQPVEVGEAAQHSTIVTHLNGIVTRRDQYKLFVALFPVEPENWLVAAPIQQYTVMLFTDGQTIAPRMISAQVSALDTQSTHTISGISSGLRNKLEVASARLHQPSFAIGFTQGYAQSTLFSVDGMAPVDALAHVKHIVSESMKMDTIQSPHLLQTMAFTQKDGKFIPV